MLDKIHNNNLEYIEQSHNLDSIKGYGATNPFLDDKNFFVDESQISLEALDKYQRELDINKFSELLKNIDPKEANNLVIEQALDGSLAFDDESILLELIDNKEFLNDIT